MKHLASRLEQLCMRHTDLTLYKAGLPGYEANFTRDSIMSGWLFENPLLLHDQLLFSAAHQGRGVDPVDGEEPGKIHHEMDLSTYEGVKLDLPPTDPRADLITTYNACDTTALFLFGHELFYDLTGSTVLMRSQKEQIVAATKYIIAHVRDGLFVEQPPGIDTYSLQVTYWKDSLLLGRYKTAYPAVFSLAHIQNLQGLRSSQRIFHRMHDGLTDDERALAAQSFAKAAEMRRSLQELYDEENGCFYIAIDDLHGKQERVRGISSDSLHALAYLQPTDIPEEWVKRITESSRALETPIGYRCLDPALDSTVKDSYHTNSVWPVEQAIINMAAHRFGLEHVANVTSRIRDRFVQEEKSLTDFEIYKPEGRGWVPGGQPHQLWTIAAKVYFGRQR